MTVDVYPERPTDYSDMVGGQPPQTGKWIEVLAGLRSCAGVWMVIAETPTSRQAHTLAYHLRKNHVAKPSGNYSFTSRKVDGGGKVYARFDG